VQFPLPSTICPVPIQAEIGEFAARALGECCTEGVLWLRIPTIASVVPRRTTAATAREFSGVESQRVRRARRWCAGRRGEYCFVRGVDIFVLVFVWDTANEYLYNQEYTHTFYFVQKKCEMGKKICLGNKKHPFREYTLICRYWLTFPNICILVSSAYYAFQDLVRNGEGWFHIT
jgi:hypothetical protein